MNNIYRTLAKKMGRFKTLDWTEDQLRAELDLINKKQSKLPSAMRREIQLHIDSIEETKQMQQAATPAVEVPQV